MTEYWAWMTEHYLIGSFISLILAWSAIRTVRFVFMAFFKVFHRKEPPRITINHPVTGDDSNEETASTLRNVADQLSPLVPETIRRSSVWERLRD
jgi:hypothetical protein